MPDHTMAILVTVVSIAVMGLFVLRWWITSPQRTVDRWLRQLKAGQKPKSPVKTDFDNDLVLTDDGFEIRPLKGQTDKVLQVVWRRVTEANAYKRDLWSTDQVCIAFTFDDETFVEIHEEMRGFATLCEQLPTVLPGALPFESWYMNITGPAFEPCLTRLYSRHSTPQSA